MEKTVLKWCGLIMLLTLSLGAMKYVSPELPEEKPHPFFTGIDFQKTSDGEIIRVGAVLLLPEKYTKKHNASLLKNDVRADATVIFRSIKPNEAMSYIENGCKLLSVKAIDVGDLYEETINRIRMYNDIKCGKRDFVIISHFDGMRGIKYLHPKPSKSLEDIIYDK